MKLYQRFAFYLLGLSIGIIFVFYFLNAKAESRGVEFCYLPNCRVLKDLRTKSFHYSDEASAKLAEAWLDTTDIRNTLRYGDVDFSKSNIPMDGGKYYIVEGKNEKKEPILLEFINYETRVV
ncbi:DUF4258 domain-containing protein, partial [Arthrospira platensis SPKY1]|nr:DUF4258 domain-containing protein [Arthrospira platensis SPKY1]